MVVATQDLVLKAFKNAFANKDELAVNSQRSSYFVSELAKLFATKFDGEPLVQRVSNNGKKSSGEWLLDIVIVSKQAISTEYRKRNSSIVRKIHWAIESEFSTIINEFGKDFSKLLHIKAENYMYIGGVNQVTRIARKAYMDAQIDLASSLVAEHQIKEPFFMVFIPTPGKPAKHDSLWDEFEFNELKSWIKFVNLHSKVERRLFT